MGNQNSTPKETTAASGGCPVPHDQRTAPAAPAAAATTVDGCPVMHSDAKKPVADVLSGGCPVKRDTAATPSTPGDAKEIYNVYGQRIDPTNMMPSNPNQEPNDAQRYPLPQDRVQSTIPKGHTDGTWLYPSEQMFFNALKRKGKGDDVHEADLPAIVSIHNNMNERAWAQVEHYERVCHPDSEPKLLKFCGRPDDLTPLAYIKNVLGYGKPFDRHDWTIVRSDDTHVRYVIDYYFDDAKTAEDAVPALHSSESVKSISMYARPAIDSVTDLVDRVRFPLLGLAGRAREPDLATRSALLDAQEQEQDATAAASETLSVKEVEQTFGQIRAACQSCFTDVKTCESERACSQAAAALQLCMGTIVSPVRAAAFQKALASGDETKIETAFDAMNDSIESFQERAASAMRQQAAREAAAAAAK